MLPINLLTEEHVHPYRYRIRTALLFLLGGIGITAFIVMVLLVLPLLLPVALLSGTLERLRRCQNCQRIGTLQIFRTSHSAIYQCKQCKARYRGSGASREDLSGPEYDDLFGKYRNVRSLLRAASRPEETEAELVRPSLLNSAETPVEQLVRPAGD